MAKKMVTIQGSIKNPIKPMSKAEFDRMAKKSASKKKTTKK